VSGRGRIAAGAEATVAEVWGEVASRLRPLLGDAAEGEARDLIAAVMEQPRFWPSLAGGVALNADVVARIAGAAERRARGAPFAYAVRSAAFRHLTLGVDERVLIPRPETEHLIDLILATPQGRRGGMAVDVGTGSGAIALALASEGAFARVIATDISGDALAVAKENAARLRPALRAAVEFLAGDALAPLRGLTESVDVLVSNPPYIAFAEALELPPSVRDWEPPQALVCPDDGLAVTRAVIAGGGELLRAGGLLAFETDSRRAGRVAELVGADGAYEDVRVMHDLTGRERFVLATRRTRA
jgi:release factor glutamine methyltransferase